MVDNHFEEEPTASINVSEEGVFFKSSLEITLTLGEEVRHYPVYRTVLRVDPVRFTVVNGQLHFESSRVVEHRREMVIRGILSVGESLSWEGGLLELHDRSGQVRGSLECYTDPFYSRIWSLVGEVVHIGRPGKRKNELELNHPTISREHAELRFEATGPRLLSQGPSWVEGEPVGPEGVALSDGALLQLSDLLFQFRLLNAPAARGRVEVVSLGSFQVRVDGELITEKAWRTQSVRWLMARLALEWGRPVAVEKLLEEFWPEMPEDKSRNNLNYSLSTLRQLLKAPDSVLRATGSVQLAPSFLGTHDLVELQRAMKAEDWGRAVDLYGEYLPGCYADWAEGLRRQLEQQTLQGGLRLLESGGDVALAGKLLALDPFCQPACLALMRGSTPSEAVRVFERFRKKLLSELGLPPSDELVAAYEQAKAAAGPVPHSDPA